VTDLFSWESPSSLNNVFEKDKYFEAIQFQNCTLIGFSIIK
jgi:hypothetical protein